MDNGVSVLIPAHNEENTIENTLTSIRLQDVSPLEIIVCANNCTDNTGNIVKDIARKDSRVNLIETDVVGKPNAWNTLYQSAKFNNLVFADADVIISDGSIKVLVQYMNNGGLVAAAPRLMKITEGFFSKIWSTPIIYTPDRNISGAMYALNKELFDLEMRNKGYSKMPDVINEDLWVTLVLEERDHKIITGKKWGTCNDATVCYQPGNVFDHYKSTKRIYKGEMQIEREHESLGYKARESPQYSNLKRWVDRWLELPITEKMTAPFIVLPRKVIYKIINYFAINKAQKEYETKEIQLAWGISASTKRAIRSQLASTYFRQDT